MMQVQHRIKQNFNFLSFCLFFFFTAEISESLLRALSGTGCHGSNIGFIKPQEITDTKFLFTQICGYECLFQKLLMLHVGNQKNNSLKSISITTLEGVGGGYGNGLNQV